MAEETTMDHRVLTPRHFRSTDTKTKRVSEDMDKFFDRKLMLDRRLYNLIKNKTRTKPKSKSRFAPSAKKRVEMKTKLETSFRQRATDVSRKHCIEEAFSISFDPDDIKTVTKDIFFVADCNYVGFHWHRIRIVIIEDGKVVNEESHSADKDGTLSYPRYEAFLCAKLSFFEHIMPNHKIHIDETILDADTFYDENY